MHFLLKKTLKPPSLVASWIINGRGTLRCRCSSRSSEFKRAYPVGVWGHFRYCVIRGVFLLLLFCVHRMNQSFNTLREVEADLTERAREGRMREIRCCGEGASPLSP